MQVGLVVEQLLAPVPGGTARYTRELARALVETAAAGDTVTGYSAWHRDINAARVTGVGGPVRLIRGRRVLARQWEKGWGPGIDADVVHAPTLLFPSSADHLVVTIHDAVPWTHPETLTPHGVRWHRAMAERAEIRASVVVVPTQAVADELAQHLQLGDRVRVIPHGTSLAAPADASERRARLRLPERYAVAVGTLEPRKGIDVAASALAHLEWPDGVGLVIAGPGGWGGVTPPRDAVLTGPLGDDDLAAVVAGAVCLVAPARSEGFGLPVLEAMAMGTPVVVSSAPALVEVAGDAGVVVPVGDAARLATAVATVSEQPGRRADLAARGIARASAFTWTASARAHWQAYADAAR